MHCLGWKLIEVIVLSFLFWLGKAHRYTFTLQDIYGIFSVKAKWNYELA